MGTILEKIYKSGLKFLEPLTPEKTFQLVVGEAMKLVKAQYGSIFFIEKGEFKRVYTSAPHLHKIQVRKRGIAYQTFKNRKAHVYKTKSLEKFHPEYKQTGIKSIISIPLSYRNQSIGVLSLQSVRSEYFTRKELNILKWFGSLVTLAIRKNQLYDEVKRALEARDLFISMAAHELRTPITTISGYSQLLYSKFAGSDTIESKWISELSWEALRLTYLVNELLEVDRIKTGQFQYTFQECNFREVVRRAIADFHFTHPDYKVILNDQLNGADVVIGDFNKLLQLVINLLDNAAKFSPSDSEIVIELKPKPRYVCLAIKDQGKGIPKQDLPNIFEKFYKGADHTKEGMGIGLFLAKNIVKQHHGDIHISSKEKKGTKVEVKLLNIRT